MPENADPPDFQKKKTVQSKFIWIHQKLQLPEPRPVTFGNIEKPEMSPVDTNRS